jgi:hypothetical protein
MADDPSAEIGQMDADSIDSDRAGSGPRTPGGGISAFDASVFPMAHRHCGAFRAIQIIYSLTSVRFLVTFQKKEKRR